MSEQGTVADRILKAVRRSPGCLLDDLECSCPDLTWNQVFLEVDRLSRTGRLRVQSKGEGIYILTLPTKGKLLARIAPVLRGTRTNHVQRRPQEVLPVDK